MMESRPTAVEPRTRAFPLEFDGFITEWYNNSISKEVFSPQKAIKSSIQGSKSNSDLLPFYIHKQKIKKGVDFTWQSLDFGTSTFF